MSKVIGLEAWVLRTSVPQFADAKNLINDREVLWVRVALDDGTIGWGEGAIFGGPAETAADVLATDVAPLVLGQPDSIHRIWDTVYQSTLMHGRRGLLMIALSALDTALWDAHARRAGFPLVDLLGRYSDRVLPYASAGFYNIDKGLDALITEMKGFCHEGFRAVKMKVGRQPRLWGDVWNKPYPATLDQDIERVLAVRSVIGPDRLLLVDANTEWDVSTATRFLKAIESADPFFIEEPVSPDNPQLAAELRAHVSVRVAGFETEYGRWAYRDLLHNGAVDVVQPDACWCGGISESRRIAALASAYGRLCVPHSLSSAVSLHVNAHLVASLDNAFLVEWDRTGNPFVDQYLSARDVLNTQGWWELPNTPGIGFTPNPASFSPHVAQHVQIS